MAGWRWVSRNAALITESAHPAEKSTPNSTDTSIHRLGSSKVLVLWWGSGTAVGFSRGDVFLLDRVRGRIEGSDGGHALPQKLASQTQERVLLFFRRVGAASVL